MATHGSAIRAEGNVLLRATCGHCGESFSTEVAHSHPLDEHLAREAWGLVGEARGRRAIFATCSACHDSGWRPPHYAGIV
jgi:5-methylcytosine-specific restriction endonuclease McrA